MAVSDTTARVVLRPGRKAETAVQIDGQEIKAVTRAVTVRGDAESYPTIELDLYIAEVDVDIEGEITLAAPTHALLVALGWTPPPEREVG